MKNLLIATLTMLTTKATYAFDMLKYYPGEMLNCPASSEQLLEITKFIPSANSNSSKGICYVKANYYSWWDLINESNTPNEVEVQVDAGLCNSSEFIIFKGQRIIKATVLYRGNVSMCGSNPGCHYECKPIIQPWSL